MRVIVSPTTRGWLLASLALLLVAGCEGEEDDTPLPERCDDDPVLCINQLDRSAIDLDDMVFMHCGHSRDHEWSLNPQGVPFCTAEEGIGLVEVNGIPHVYSPGLCDGTCRVSPSLIEAIAASLDLPWGCGCPGAHTNFFNHCMHCAHGYRCDDADGPWIFAEYRPDRDNETTGGAPKSPYVTDPLPFIPCSRVSHEHYRWERHVTEDRALTCSVPASHDDSWQTFWCMRLIPRALVPEGAEDQLYELDELADYPDDWNRIRGERVSAIQTFWEEWQRDPSIRIRLEDWLESERRPPDSLDGNGHLGSQRLLELLDQRESTREEASP